MVLPFALSFQQDSVKKKETNFMNHNRVTRSRAKQTKASCSDVGESSAEVTSSLVI